MITVTRLNETPVVVNADLIELIEQTPDTLITLTTGRKLNVKESVNTVVEKVVRYRRLLFTGHPAGTR